jgi:hypothetical protein
MAADLSRKVTVRAAGTGTTESMPYCLDRHKILLIDCVGDSATIDIARSVMIAADAMIVFLQNGVRCEQMHADAMLLAWRLRTHMVTAFVAGKADIDLTSDERKGIHTTLGKELHAKLVRSQQATEASFRKRLEMAAPNERDWPDDVADLLRDVDGTLAEEWASTLLEETWIRLLGYYCRKDYEVEPPKARGVQGARWFSWGRSPVVELEKERSELRDVVLKPLQLGATLRQLAKKVRACHLRVPHVENSLRACPRSRFANCCSEQSFFVVTRPLSLAFDHGAGMGPAMETCGPWLRRHIMTTST